MTAGDTQIDAANVNTIGAYASTISCTPIEMSTSSRAGMMAKSISPYSCPTSAT